MDSWYYLEDLVLFGYLIPAALVALSLVGIILASALAT
jgi:hypothetical protein